MKGINLVVIGLLFALVIIGLAADSTTALTPTEEVSILRPEREQAHLQSEIKDMQARYAQLQNEAAELQRRFPAVQQQLQDADKAVEKAVDAVYVAHHYTRDQMDFDKTQLKFVPAPPKPAAPATEKKP